MPTTGLPPLRVLVADDDDSARRLLEAFLPQWGYEVQSVADGAAAWQVLRGPHAPRLALLDWKMPGLDGPEVCRRVRAAHPEGPRYLVLLTAQASAGNLIEGLEAGADDFVTKPFDHRELRARLGVGSRVVRLENELQDRVVELQHALANVDRLKGLLPICSYCHAIQQDEVYWQRLDQYIMEHTEVKFSHGICPQCYETHLQPQLDALTG